MAGFREKAQYLNGSDTEVDRASVAEIDHADDRNQSMAYAKRESVSAAERARRNLNAKLANPLAGLSHEALRKRGGNYARKYQVGEEEDIRAFELGAILAQAPEKYDRVQGFTDTELKVLGAEFSSRWSQPKQMYLVIVVAAVCAAVQGMGRSFFISSRLCIFRNSFTSTYVLLISSCGVSLY